ncbi:MAG: homoserine dehydrogenase [Myxococcota bacterium]
MAVDRSVRIGLLGCGVVGAALTKLIADRRDDYRGRHGIDLDLTRIAVADLERDRPAHVPRDLLTEDVREVTDDPDIQVIVEVIGGTTVAFDAVCRALNQGKDVVTANKAIVAEKGAILLDLAHQSGAQLRFEAAVGGGVPVLGALLSGLSASRMDAIDAIVNGTSNFILSRMANDRMDYNAAVRIAQERGFAEADPTLDVNGTDAAHKLSILTALGFGVAVDPEEIPREGIDSVTREDIEAAHRFDYELRHLAVARRSPNGIELRVNPAFLPRGTFLATVQDEFNAFMVRGSASKEMVFIGRGAGADPTAGAVLGDVVECATRRLEPQPAPSLAWGWSADAIADPLDAETGYYFRFPVCNEPGAIGTLSTILGEHGVNIDNASARQDPDDPRLGIVEILSQRSTERSVRAATAAVDTQRLLRDTIRVIRIEEWRPSDGYF